MSRRKTRDEDIELGIVGDDVVVEDEAIMDEAVPEEESGALTQAQISRVSNGEVWFYIHGFGYIFKPEKIEDWMKVGAKTDVIHQGMPGQPDFVIVGLLP